MSLISALITFAAHAQSQPACGPCAFGAQCIAGSCQFACARDTDCRHENVCVEGRCEPRLPNQRAGAPATIRRGDATHPERFKESHPIPPGFHLAQEPHWELVARGAVAFTSAYLPVAIIALARQNPVLAIPLAGPILGYQADVGPLAGFLNAVLIGAIAVDVSVQLAGICMVIAGLAKPTRWLERDKLSFLPTAPGAPVGASLTGRF